MHRLISSFTIVMISACSLELRDFAGEPQVLAATITSSSEKICAIANDCVVIDQDCCFTAQTFISVNKSVAEQVKARLQWDCNAQRKKNPDLCKAATIQVNASTTAVCENAQCGVVLTAQTSAQDDKTVCSIDSDCMLFDRDCCDSDGDVVAINYRFIRLERESKGKECSKKLYDDPSLCRGKSAPFVHKLTKAACRQSHCLAE